MQPKFPINKLFTKDTSYWIVIAVERRLISISGLGLRAKRGITFSRRSLRKAEVALASSLYSSFALRSCLRAAQSSCLPIRVVSESDRSENADPAALSPQDRDGGPAFKEACLKKARREEVIEEDGWPVDGRVVVPPIKGDPVTYH